MKLQDSLLFILPLIGLAIILAAPYSTLASSLLDNPDAEAVVQQNKELNEPIEASSPIIKPKSPGKAFLFSAAVPGSGELYSGAKRGGIFAAAEIAFWTAYIMIHSDAEDVKEDYIAFVDEHIVFEDEPSPPPYATSTENWTLEDYEHATQSDNWHYVYTEENGMPVDRVGKFYWDDLPADRIDQPGSVDMVSQSRAEAFEMRHSANGKFKRAKFFLGLVVANHIVSAIDARIAATIYNNRILKTAPEISLHPTISPSGNVGAYLALYKRF